MEHYCRFARPKHHPFEMKQPLRSCRYYLRPSVFVVL
jgi:hypothetical protein